MYPHKKPVGRKTFLQGSEILQVLKNSSGEKTKKQKQSKPQKPKLHNKQEQH